MTSKQAKLQSALTRTIIDFFSHEDLYSDELRIQGTLCVTADKNAIFVAQITETVRDASSRGNSDRSESYAIPTGKGILNLSVSEQDTPRCGTSTCNQLSPFYPADRNCLSDFLVPKVNDAGERAKSASFCSAYNFHSGSAGDSAKDKTAFGKSTPENTRNSSSLLDVPSGGHFAHPVGSSSGYDLSKKSKTCHLGDGSRSADKGLSPGSSSGDRTPPKRRHNSDDSDEPLALDNPAAKLSPLQRESPSKKFQGDFIKKEKIDPLSSPSPEHASLDNNNTTELYRNKIMELFGNRSGFTALASQTDVKPMLLAGEALIGRQGEEATSPPTSHSASDIPTQHALLSEAAFPTGFPWNLGNLQHTDALAGSNAFSGEWSLNSWVRKPKTKFTPEQLEALDREYRNDPFLSTCADRRANLARKLCLTEKNIQIWFQNQRRRRRAAAYSRMHHIYTDQPAAVAESMPHSNSDTILNSTASGGELSNQQSCDVVDQSHDQLDQLEDPNAASCLPSHTEKKDMSNMQKISDSKDTEYMGHQQEVSNSNSVNE